MKVNGIMVFDSFGQNLHKDFNSFAGQKTIDLPLSYGICLIKQLSKYQFPIQKITIQN